MKQTSSTAEASLPSDPSTPNFGDDTHSMSIGVRFFTWLKHFALYLGTVAIIFVIGFYFLLRIPIPQDAAQLFKIAGNQAMPKTLVAVLSPPAPIVSIPIIPPPPTVNSASAVPGLRSVPTNSGIPTLLPATETADDPNVAPPLPEQPVVTSADSSDPAVEVLGPTTPEMEIEKLLVDAQQQIDNRRFTAPASGNALSSYRRILEIRPDQPAALEGIQRIAAYYRDAAQQSLQQGKVDEGLGYINRGLRAAPKDDTLLSLRLEARRAKQRQQEAQRTLQEEVRRERVERAQLEPKRTIEEQQQPSWWQQPSQSQDGGFNQR